MARLARRLFCVALLSAATIAGAAAQQPAPGPADIDRLHEAARREGRLVWYESAPLEPMQAVAAAFERRFPGIKVDVLRIVGVQQYERYMQETRARRHLADIVHISDYPSMKTLAEDGHLVAWRVPSFDRIPAVFRLGEFAYAPYTTDNAIIYNTNRVSEEEVRLLASDWRAILDPRFRGRFAVTSMKCGACYAAIHMFLDPALRDRYGPDFLRAIAAQRPAVYSEVLVGLDRVIAGEHDFTFWTWEAIAIARRDAGAPIRWIHPTPTPEFGNTWQGISRYAPNPNAARLFQTWTMSEEGMTALQTLYGARTTLEGMADARPAVREPWYTGIRQRYDIDFDRWDRDYHKDMDLWIRILREAR